MTPARTTMALGARDIFDRLAATHGDAVAGFEEAIPGDVVAPGPRDACFRCRPERIADVMRALRDDPDLAFDFLQNLTVVDWTKRDVMEVVYHLFSYVHRHSCCVKVELPRATPRLPSVTGTWPAANWLEREQYDLLGVVFEGHPDLRRLLMPDDWVGHPMRKDFHEPKSYRGMPTSRPSPMNLILTYDRAHVARAVAATASPAPSSFATTPTTPEVVTEGSSPGPSKVPS